MCRDDNESAPYPVVRAEWGRFSGATVAMNATDLPGQLIEVIAP